jgi:single-stranded-DNA-specific exonuclease
MQAWPRPDTMLGLSRAANALAQAVDLKQSLCIVADYDCDGATACAVLLLGLRRLGAKVDFVVPNRFRHGYGLSPGVVEEIASALSPHWLVTVDQGITSIEGVAKAQGLGMQVIVTDHHLPGSQLPIAYAVLDPHQPGCSFSGRAIAGVGVAFYLLLGVRAALRASTVRLDDLLSLVALGTIADLAPLDALNRSLVMQGLQRMRKGTMPPGLRALMEVAGVDPTTVKTSDLGFRIGPRINAAGRLESMRAGIACLTAPTLEEGLDLAAALDATNTERKSIERSMREQAFEGLQLEDASSAPVLWRSEWHEGVVGLVATRLREKSHRPAIALAPAHEAGPNLWRGSGRSITGFHMRDALQRIDARAPGVLLRYGGHAMAAGITVQTQNLARFAELFREEVADQLGSDPGQEQQLHDGPLPLEPTLQWAKQLESEVWGQGYPEPLFVQPFNVAQQRVIKGMHLACRLKDQRTAGSEFDAIWFGRSEPLPPNCQLAFHVSVDRYLGTERVKLLVQHLVPQ